MLFGVICVMFRYGVNSGFIIQREAFCPFSCSGIICGFLIHSVRFPLSCSSVTLSPIPSHTSVFSLPTQPCHCLDHGESKGEMQANAACLLPMGVFPQNPIVDALKRPHCEPFKKLNHQGHHMNQGAKRSSHRWSYRSPKTEGSPHASQRWHCLPQGNCPFRCPPERTPRKPPKPSEKGANHGASTTQAVLLSEYNVPGK